MRLPPTEEILPHLDGARRSGGGWVAHCPVINAHQNGDRNASFSITDGDEQTLVHCFSGCAYDDVALAIFGLLGPDRSGRDDDGGGGGLVANGQTMDSPWDDPPAPDPALEPAPGPSEPARGVAPVPVPAPGRRVVATYEYRAVEGRPLYRQVRYDPKGFSRQYPDGSGGWSDIRPADPPAATLYRLPELLASNTDRPVWVVEGEKDADRLVSLGLVATTSGGATSWKKEFGEYFEGRKVIIVPDNDVPGRKFAGAVAASCDGRAVSVRTLRLPVVSAGDVSDYLEAGHSVQNLFELALQTREYPPRRWTPQTLAEAKIPPLEGFVNDALFCRQTVGMIAGRRGLGKTWLLLKLGYAVSTGTHWGPYPTRKGRVVLFSQEMTEVELRDRLLVLFGPAELKEMSNLTIVCRENVRIDTDDAVERFSAMLEPLRPDLVMIDTLSHVKGAIPENDNDEMGAGARRLIDQIATPHNCAVVVTHHAGREKADGTSNPRGASSWEDMLADIMFLEHPKNAAFKVGTFAEPNGKVRHAAVPDRLIYTIASDEGRVEVDLMRDNGMIADRDTLMARIVGLIEQRGAMPVNEIAERLAVSRAIARDAVQGAKTMGLIERIGTGVDARWMLRVSAPTNDGVYD